MQQQLRILTLCGGHVRSNPRPLHGCLLRSRAIDAHAPDLKRWRPRRRPSSLRGPGRSTSE
eukprot:1700913-Pyramimonas_sp.AAC.1